MRDILANLSSANPAWIVVSCFGLMIASALIPWVNAEVIVAFLPTLTRSPANLLALFLVAVAGHMTGKSVLYWISRRGGRAMRGKMEAAMAKWRDRLISRPAQGTSLVLVSSVIGIPPFYLITVAAGAFRMNFATYLAAGTVGRILRFGAVLSLLDLVLTWLRRG